MAVVGYSTRSLAEAVKDLGLEVIAVDHFADCDTRELARCIAIENWPHGIFEAVANLFVDAILVSGGMENLPRVMRKLSGTFRFVGMSAATMKKLRDLEFLRPSADGSGVRIPEIMAGHWLARDGEQWLWKPLSSAGGMGIRDARDLGWCAPSSGGHWQRKIQGRHLGISCIVSRQRAFVIGATQSLTSVDFPGPAPYIYRGSVGPVSLERSAIERIERFCEGLAARRRLNGWLQFDMIESEDGELWLLECNPRWTAGMEILRLCGLANMARFHLACNFYGNCHDELAGARTWDCWAGKAIFYAQRPCAFNAIMRAALTDSFRQWTIANNQTGAPAVMLDMADIPDGEQNFETGQPVLTLRLKMNRRAVDGESAAMSKLTAYLKEAASIASSILGRA